MISAGKLVFLITFFALLLQSLYVFSTQPDEFMFIPFVLICGGAISLYLLYSKSDSPENNYYLLNLVLWAFSLRLWAGIIFYGWRFSEALGDEDASGYASAWKLAENWFKFGVDGFLSDLYLVTVVKQNVGQALIWGIPMFFAGGPSRMIVSAANSFAGALLVLVIFRFTKRLFDVETARIAALLVTFWPSIILFSAGTSKEILVILFAWSALYVVTRNSKGLALKDGIWAAIFSFFLFIIRFYSVYMMGVAVAFRVLTAKSKHIVRNTIIGLVAVSSITAFLFYTGAIKRDFERLEWQNQYIDTWRKGVAQDTSSGVVIYGQYDSATVAIPVAAAYFLLAPFPWEMFSGSGRNGFAAVENIVVLVILALGFRSLRVFFTSKFFVMLPILTFCVLYAGFQIWGMANVGLAWRHKQTIMPLLFMLVSFSIAQSRSSWAALIRGIGRPAQKMRSVPSRLQT